MPVVINPNTSGQPGVGSTLTLQSVVDSARAYPELKPILSTGGFTQQPAITIANDVMQRFLAQAMDWKFNRAVVPPFLTVSLQQDYDTQVTNLAWLEQGWKLDINNTVQPKPIFVLETIRDIAQTSYQNNPFNLSYIPNRLAFFGNWQPNTYYGCGYGQAATPVSPIQQFVDVNGNILYIDSTVLNLNQSSPGYGQIITFPSNSPYGVTGGVQPAAAANSPAGTLVQDGGVTWTVADPNGYAIRTAPLPATSGLCWLLTAVYQKSAPIFTSLQQTIYPIPDYYGYLFRQGFMAIAYQHAGSKMAGAAYSQWEEALLTALRSADREREDAVFYPSESLATGGTGYGWPWPLGPAFPYNPFLY